MTNHEHYDLIVRNATIIDGTRAARFHGEIGVRAGMIASIGALDRATAAARRRDGAVSARPRRPVDTAAEGGPYQ